MIEFCRCDNCGMSILVGQECYSLTLARELIETRDFVTPTVATQVATWCIECGPDAVRNATAEFCSESR